MNEVTPGRRYQVDPDIDWVKISPETDGVDGLYIDCKLVTQGDYYHDKISDYIAGFLAGLKYSGVWSGKYRLRELNHEHETATNIVELGERLPDLILDLPIEDMTCTDQSY